MSDAITLSQRMRQLDVSPQFAPYSKVTIHVSDDTVIEAGNDTGRNLDITNPFGTQAIAEDILASLTGYQYQPYKAEGAILDPSAEIGDGANMRGIYGGIYKRSRKFGRLMTADISAPHDEEINHEYKYESPKERKYTRQLNDVRASLRIASDNILAEVVKKEDGNTQSFGWTLLSDSWKVYSNGSPVLSVDKDGLEIAGRIRAGTKVGGDGGFNISATAIWNNISAFGGSQSSGVYVGTDGIQLGQAFKVTPTGAVTANNISANNMTLTGTLNIGGSTITAAALRQGAQSAYSNGGTWSAGAGYGYNYNAATASASAAGPTYFNAGQVRARNTLVGGSLACNGAASVGGNLTVFGSFRTGGYYATWITKTIAGTTITYLGR